jgi:RimJ/RimL family protein N-acetyltransferase
MPTRFEIKGSKVTVREGLIDEELSLLLGWFHDVEVMKYIMFFKKALALKDVRELEKFLKWKDDARLFSIVENKSGKFVGYASLEGFSEDSCEFGIMIGDKGFWGKGMGREVTELMLNYSFSKLGLRRIWLQTSEYNVRAINLYEKIGFNVFKKVPDDREIYEDGEWVRSGSDYMELGREDWKGYKNID